MSRWPKILGYGAAAAIVVAALGILVLGELRGVPPKVAVTPPFVAEPPKAPVSDPKPAVAPATRPLPAIDRWLAAGGDGDESGLGDPATYDEALVKKLVERYDALPMESRRERGALVYLLARTNPEKDALVFLAGVLREKPCASLENCARPATGHDDHDPSLVTTLAYPQLMALAMAEDRAQKSETPAEWRALAEEAKRSDVQSVKRRAEQWLAGSP